MDPAHIQRDIFQQDFSEKAQRVANHLAAKIEAFSLRDTLLAGIMAAAKEVWI
jgi:hypothetical protein